MGTPTATSPQLTPFALHTPSQTPTVTPIITSTQEPLLPSPTPFTYQIQQGDTLFGLALQFNTTVDEIIAANPGKNTSVLSIGQELVIPTGEVDTGGQIPTPTPFPVTLSPPTCYPASDGGLWCFTSVVNVQDSALENLSAVVNLHAPNGEISASKIAYPPLNVIDPGENIPLMVHIPPPLPDTYQVFSSLQTALPSSQGRQSVPIVGRTDTPSPSGDLVTISGKLNLEGIDLAKTREIWITAIAYDSRDQVVGLRKWVSPRDLSSDTSQSHPFQFTIYSLGPEIDRVRLVTERH